MFFSNKFKWLGINSSFIFVGYLQRKKLQERLSMEEANKPEDKKHKNVFFSNMTPEQFKKKTQHEEFLLNYKSRIQEYRQAAIFEDLSDLFDMHSRKIELNKAKKYLEEAVYVGNDNELPNRGFIQVNIGKLRRMLITPDQKDPYQNKSEDEILLDDPFNYFQKLLVFKIGNDYHATGSFCSYDLTDLKEGILLGDKVTCPTCLSEYYITDGSVENGPAVKNLAYFPVQMRDDKIFVKVPLDKIPVFANPIVADYNNEVDPRHVVLIGDTDTVAGALNNLRLFFTGKISIVTNKGDYNFVDSNKLTKSMFPLKARHAKFFDNRQLNEMGINVYDEKVHLIDGEKRIITLKNKMKIPFDKVLIAVGSNREKLAKAYENIYTLQNIKDHADIHNAIIKDEVKSIALIGENMKVIEIASSIRRYLDALGRESVNIAIVSEKLNVIEQQCGNHCMKIIQDYLKRNRIFIFRGNEIELEEEIKESNENELNSFERSEDMEALDDNNNNTNKLPKLKNIIIKGEKYVFKLPVDMAIYENGLEASKCEFVNRIFLTKDLNSRPVLEYPNIFHPDERMSLNEGIRYPTIFASGNCSYLNAPAVYHSKLRSDNMRINYQLGYFAALNMFEFHYPFDDVTVENCKILDKNLFYIGVEPFLETIGYSNPIKTVRYINDEKQQFVVYNYGDDNKLIGCFVFGFKNLHMFIREAIRYKFIPQYSFANKHKNTLHRQITEAVLKNTDNIKCIKNFALKNVNNISTNKYTIEDQQITEDLMKRGLMAYNDLTKKYREEDLEKQKEEEQIKRELFINKKILSSNKNNAADNQSSNLK